MKVYAGSYDCWTLFKTQGTRTRIFLNLNVVQLSFPCYSPVAKNLSTWESKR